MAADKPRQPAYGMLSIKHRL